MNRFDKAAEGIQEARTAVEQISLAAERLRDACERFEAAAIAVSEGTDLQHVREKLRGQIAHSESIRQALREKSAVSFPIAVKNNLNEAWEALP